jgi:hypothetical protein
MFQGWFLVAAVVVSACSSTKLTTAWRAPTQEPIRFTKVLALAINDSEAFRREAEDAICGRVQPTRCVAAYNVIPPGELSDVDKAKARVKAAGFDGAVVFRVVDARDRVTYVPPTYGPTFWGYYGYAAPMMVSPGYNQVDRLVRVETSIYSVTDDRLLWVGTTETVNPTSLPKLVEEIAAAVAKDMRKAGMLAPEG